MTDREQIRRDERGFETKESIGLRKLRYYGGGAALTDAEANAVIDRYDALLTELEQAERERDEALEHLRGSERAWGEQVLRAEQAREECAAVKRNEARLADKLADAERERDVIQTDRDTYRRLLTEAEKQRQEARGEAEMAEKELDDWKVACEEAQASESDLMAQLAAVRCGA